MKKLIWMILILFAMSGCATTAVRQPQSSVFDQAEEAGKLVVDTVEVLPGLALYGDIDSTMGAWDWDLIDNNASALSFDTAGLPGLLEFVTTNGSEMLKTSSGLTIATTKPLYLGTTRIDDGSNKLDGEQIADDTIDDDSIDWTDVEVTDLETSVNILLETEIDASSELYALMDDETGSGGGTPLLVFNYNPTLTGLTLAGDIAQTGAAYDWDLIDNNSAALSFDADGKARILNIITTNNAEGIESTGDLWIKGGDINLFGSSPIFMLRDSDAAGSNDDDKDVAFLSSQMTTTTEDGEIGDLRAGSIGTATAGTMYTNFFFDSSEQFLKLGVMSDADAPAAVPGFENIYIDFNPSTDNQIDILTDSGVTNIDLGAISLTFGSGSSAIFESGSSITGIGDIDASGDLDAGGADLTLIEDTAGVKGYESTATVSSEVSDIKLFSKGTVTAGTKYTNYWWDSSAQTLYLGIMTDADTPLEVANYEYLSLDFDTATDAQLGVGGVFTEIDLGAKDVTTTGTGTFGDIDIGSSATPGFTAYDSGAPGSDKEVGKMWWDYVDGGDGSENADVIMQAMQGGSEHTFLQYDESDDQLEVKDNLSVDEDLAVTGSITGKPAFVLVDDTDTDSTIAAGDINKVHLITDTDTHDYDIADGLCDAAADIGNWVVVRKKFDFGANTISLTSNDASNIFVLADNTDVTAGDELDMADGCHQVCLVCLAAEYWYVTGYIGTAPADGGAAD